MKDIGEIIKSTDLTVTKRIRLVTQIDNKNNISMLYHQTHKNEA